MHADVPLQVIRPGIFVLPVRAKRADVAGRFMNKAVSNHFVLALEPLASRTTGTAANWTVMRPHMRMHIRVRTGRPVNTANSDRKSVV